MSEFTAKIETTTQLPNRWCKFVAISLAFLLSYSPFLLLILFYYLYGIWVGIAGVILGYIVTSIIVSKIRVATLDFESNQMNYKTYDLIKIYLNRDYCLEFTEDPAKNPLEKDH